MEECSAVDDSEIAFTCLAGYAVLLVVMRKCIIDRQIWTTSGQILNPRDSHGGLVLPQLQLDRVLELFNNFCRISPADFNILLTLIKNNFENGYQLPKSNKT